jgi:hypothetical protein
MVRYPCMKVLSFCTLVFLEILLKSTACHFFVLIFFLTVVIHGIAVIIRLLGPDDMNGTVNSISWVPEKN